MKILKRSNRFAQPSEIGAFRIRVYHRKGTDKRSPRYLLKCGCCDERLEIYYDSEALEINGVNGSVEDWREILLPLLRIEEIESQLTVMQNNQLLTNQFS